MCEKCWFLLFFLGGAILVFLVSFISWSIYEGIQSMIDNRIKEIFDMTDLENIKKFICETRKEVISSKRTFKK